MVPTKSILLKMLKYKRSVSLKGDLMIGPAGLEERPADSRTSGQQNFLFLPPQA
jgi:hypothetical protein